MITMSDDNNNTVAAGQMTGEEIFYAFSIAESLSNKIDLSL